MSNNKKPLWGNRGKHHEMSIFGKKRTVRRVIRAPQPPIPVRQPLNIYEEKETVEYIIGNNADEEEARIKAEEEARLKAEEEARLKAEEEARIKAEEEARIKAEEEEARLKAEEEEARIKAEEEARIKAEEEEARLKAEEEEARIKAEEEARIKAEEEEARLKAEEEEARIKAEEEARIAEEEWQKNNLTPEEIEANKRYQAEEEETARLLALQEQEDNSEPVIEDVYEEKSVSPGENLLSSNKDELEQVENIKV
jgi:hypothetical protein